MLDVVILTILFIKTVFSFPISFLSNAYAHCFLFFLCWLRLLGSPGWHGSVGWVLSHKAKGCWFDSQLGHMPGLWAWSLVGMYVRGNQLMFLSYIDIALHLCLPIFPSL